MEIREPHSLGSLFIESFRVTNRAFGRIVVYFILAIVGTVLQELLLLLHIFPLVVALLNAVYSAFLVVLFFKIIASQAESDLTSLSDLMSASALPAIYILILSLIYMVVALVAGFAGALLSGIFSPAVLLILAPVALFFFLRLLFAPISIALRDHGPIRGILYSWELTRGHFFFILLTVGISVGFPLLCVAGIAYGLYVGIPLYFADSFNLAQLSATWWIVLALLAVLIWFVWLSMSSFLVLVFLNLDYAGGSSPVPQVLQTPQEHENGTALSTGAAMASKTTHAPNVQVLKASVKTHTSDESLDKHLNEVYQPLPQENVVQTEEDRMPTIVFDEEMAAQMAREREQWEQEKAKAQQAKQNQGNNGEDTVKMSK